MPQSEEQKETVARVMHEAKHGELKTGTGKSVRNPRQAIAIALHEAGASKYEDDATNRRDLAHTKDKEAHGETARDEAEGTAGKTKAELYEEAKEQSVEGRSKMDRAELAAAVGKRG